MTYQSTINLEYCRAGEDLRQSSANHFTEQQYAVKSTGEVLATLARINDRLRNCRSKVRFGVCKIPKQRRLLPHIAGTLGLKFSCPGAYVQTMHHVDSLYKLSLDQWQTRGQVSGHVIVRMS